MLNWNTCIISYIDLIGIKSQAERGGSLATDTMRKMHCLVETAMNERMINNDQCYIWNDSILLLSYMNGDRNENSIIKEVDSLKKEIDKICGSYAISVKGMAFPDEELINPAALDIGIREQPRTIKLKTSSYAMANCFEIEKKLNKYKKPWYIDERISKKLKTEQAYKVYKVNMLPKKENRGVFVYEGYLWDSA